MDKVRVDKWLWSVRIFKSRTLATESCKTGKVKINDEKLKPSQLISVGDVIQVRKEGYDMVFKVVKLISKRVGAPIAVECYEDLTPEDELNKFKSWYIGKAAAERRDKGAGRPTKRERRQLEAYKNKLKD